MHLGLIGGIGPAATALYHARLAAAVPGGLELTIVHAQMRTLLANAASGRAEAQAEIFARLIDRLAGAGAGVAAITAIGGHFCMTETAARATLPLVSAIAPLDAHLTAEGIGRVGLLGTPAVMRSRLFGRLATETVVLEGEIDAIGAAYQEMALAGRCTPEQRALFVGAGRRMMDAGAEAIALVGTDLALAFNAIAPGYPVVDAIEPHVAHLAALATGVPLDPAMLA